MPGQEKKLAKKRGRPATGTGQTVGVRLQPIVLEAIDAAVAASGLRQTRSTAVRVYTTDALIKGGWLTQDQQAGRELLLHRETRALTVPAGADERAYKPKGGHRKAPVLPVGPATDAFAAMEDAVKKDRGKAPRSRGKRLASIKGTGEELPQAEWERFEQADKKPPDAAIENRTKRKR